jgi:phosphatidylserine/phosphatidylglycerophosphate/cardiolipin synthase-like enzyme
MTPIYSLLSSASRSLDMTMYELADPEAESLLEEDARRGVVVRVLLDRDDAGQRVNGPAFGQLQAGGVQVRWAPNDYLFHQKTVTVDHRISAVMTLNLTSQYYPTTRDFAVLTTDPDDVAAIEQVFDADWASGQSAPGPGPTATDLVWSPGAGPALVALINGASRTLQVENEEMGDADITAALVAAAARGVRVQVTMTDDATWGRAFAELETGGVQVRTYTESAPLYIHAKVVVADGVTAYVGSQNFSYSSLDDNRELGVVTADPAVVAGLATTLTRDFDGAAPFGG